MTKAVLPAILIALLQLACNQPSAPVDCSSQEAKITELQAELERVNTQLAEAIAQKIVTRANPPSRHQRNPWAESFNMDKDGLPHVYFVNRASFDDGAPALAIDCKNGKFKITAVLGSVTLPAGAYGLTLQYADGFQRSYDMNLPKPDSFVDLPKNVMDDILGRESIELIITKGSSDPQPLSYGPFVLVGIEEHLRNPMWSNTCGL